MSEGRTFRADGQDWRVTLEAPGKLLSVDPALEKSGALLPEHQLRIVFSSGDQRFGEEYTELTPVEDLSEEDLAQWYRAARAQRGL